MGTAVIETVVGTRESLGGRIRSEDPLELSADLRARPHFRMATRSGRELMVSLERGVELQEGDVLLLEGDAAVVVHAAPEDVLSVMPRTAREWGVIAFQLGNLHRDVRFVAEAILTPYEESTEMVLRASGVPFARIQRPFTGDRYGAYTGDHGHDHSHGTSPHYHAIGRGQHAHG